MIERLAVVFSEALADGVDSGDYLARLALTVLREPTEAMISEGAYQVPGSFPDTLAAKAVWQEMIDSALTPSPPHQG